MNINGMQVDSFGIWNGLTIGELPDDVTVFYGPNEAGKSTLMSFIRTILFGFSPDKCQRFVTGSLPRPGGRLGGRLRLSCYEGQFEVRRYADETEPLASPGDVRVTSVDGGRAGAHKLASLLSGIDESIFNNVFCVGMSEIQQLSSLNNTQAAQFLYGLSTGTDRVSLVDVMRQLRTAKTRLVGNGEPGLLAELIRRRNEQRRTIEQLGCLTDNWVQLRSELASLDREVKRLETRRDSLQRQLRTAEIAVGLRPKWLRSKKLAAEIEALGPTPDLPAGIFERLRSVDERILQRQRECAVLEQRRESLVQSEKELNLNDRLRQNAARVKALLDQRSWIGTLDDEVRRLESRTEEIEFEIQAELEKLGVVPAADGTSSVPQIDADAVSALRGPARLVKLSKKRLDAAKREAARHKADAARIGQEITRQLGNDAKLQDELGLNDVTQTREKSGSAAADLRRPKALRRFGSARSDRLEAIELHRKRILQSQLLPPSVLVALAMSFAIGSILLLSAIFGAGTLVSESRRGFLLSLGAILTGTAIGLKLLLDRTHKGILDDSESKRRDLAEQLADADDERARIEANLPIGHARARLDDVDGMRNLEELMPLDAQRRQALELAAAAERRAIEIATSLKKTHLEWKQALAAISLPTRLSPGQVRRLAGRAGILAFLRRQFEDGQDHLERARRELAAARGRILDVMAEAEIKPSTQQPLEQLEQLNEALQDQQQRVAKRDEIRRHIRGLRRQEIRLTSGIRRLEHKRTTMLASANVSDVDDLRRLDEQRQQVISLQRQHDDLNEDIAVALHTSADEALVRQQFENSSGEELKNRLQQTQHDAMRLEEQLKEVLHQRGQLTQQLKTLVQDRQLPEAHIQLAIIEQELRDGLFRWKALSATTQLLRRVYKRYEKDRQPETLQKASEFLHRMTGGRYVRIWTPLAEDVLLIDDSQGHSLPVEVMSRGTREQVFLSLRLALVGGFARRGVRIPMVLDDVLVNFDVDRRVAAAEVLVEFARSGHQIFVFTCHDHIVRTFQDLDVEIRDLPQREATLANAANLPIATPVPTQRDTIEAKHTDVVLATAAAPHGVGSFLGDMVLPSVLHEAAVNETDELPIAAHPSPPVLEPAALATSSSLNLSSETVIQDSGMADAVAPTVSPVDVDLATNDLPNAVVGEASWEEDVVDLDSASITDAREEVDVDEPPDAAGVADAPPDHSDSTTGDEDVATEINADTDVESEEVTEDDEYEYEEVDEEVDDEDVEYEYEYVDEDGNPIDEGEEELEDDEEYEWVDVDDEAELGDEAA